MHTEFELAHSPGVVRDFLSSAPLSRRTEAAPLIRVAMCMSNVGRARAMCASAIAMYHGRRLRQRVDATTLLQGTQDERAARWWLDWSALGVTDAQLWTERTGGIAICFAGRPSKKPSSALSGGIAGLIMCNKKSRPGVRGARQWLLLIFIGHTSRLRYVHSHHLCPSHRLTTYFPKMGSSLEPSLAPVPAFLAVRFAAIAFLQRSADSTQVAAQAPNYLPTRPLLFVLLHCVGSWAASHKVSLVSKC